MVKCANLVFYSVMVILNNGLIGGIASLHLEVKWNRLRLKHWIYEIHQS